jgi:hypothetical protein
MPWPIELKLGCVAKKYQIFARSSGATDGRSRRSGHRRSFNTDRVIRAPLQLGGCNDAIAIDAGHAER